MNQGWNHKTCLQTRWTERKLTDYRRKTNPAVRVVNRIPRKGITLQSKGSYTIVMEIIQLFAQFLSIVQVNYTKEG